MVYQKITFIFYRCILVPIDTAFTHRMLLVADTVPTSVGIVDLLDSQDTMKYFLVVCLRQSLSIEGWLW